jgi:lactoylglutathione lyase
MTAMLEKVFGYQGDPMHLPVGDLASAVPFYESMLGFRVVSRSADPHPAAVLERDQLRIGLAENGGDPTQDGCAFHVRGLDALYAEFRANGLQQGLGAVGDENRDGALWRVFFVIAPDGLCYWFGEQRVPSV